MSAPRNGAGTFTGRKMLLVTVGAFAIIIAVNLTLAVKAIATFPGLEVPNSYVASQSFDRDRAAQQALGWTAQPALSDGRFRLTLTAADGRPADALRVAATIGRPTGRRSDQSPDLRFDGSGWSAPLTLAPGLWHIWLEAEARDGTLFRQRLSLRVN